MKWSAFPTRRKLLFRPAVLAALTRGGLDRVMRSWTCWEPYDKVTRNVGAGPVAKRPSRGSRKRRPRRGQLTTGIPFHSSNGDAPTTRVSLKTTPCEQSTGFRVGIFEIDPQDKKGGPEARVLVSYSHLTTGPHEGDRKLPRELAARPPCSWSPEIPSSWTSKSW